MAFCRLAAPQMELCLDRINRPRKNQLFCSRAFTTKFWFQLLVDSQPTVINDGPNRQILARMEKLLWECKSFNHLLDMTTKMDTRLLEVPGVQLAVCKRSRMIAMQTQACDQCVANLIGEVEFDECEEWTEDMPAMANEQMLAAMFLSA